MCKQKAPKHQRYTCCVYSTIELVPNELYSQRFFMKHKTDAHALKWAAYLATGEGVQYVRLSRRHFVVDDVYPKRAAIAPIRVTPALGAPKYKRGEAFHKQNKYTYCVTTADGKGGTTKRVYRMRQNTEKLALMHAEHQITLPGILHVKVTGVLGGKAGESRDFKRENS